MLGVWVQWHIMGLSGLQDFEKPFKVEAASIAKARERALMAGCTRMQVKGGDVTGNADGAGGKSPGIRASTFTISSPLGAELSHLDRIPFWKTELRRAGGRRKLNLREFGCSAGITLYLRFNVEFAAVCVLAFIVSIPHVGDNARRNTLRNRCRAALQYDCMPFPHGTLARRDQVHAHAYAHMHVRTCACTSAHAHMCTHNVCRFIWLPTLHALCGRSCECAQ